MTCVTSTSRYTCIRISKIFIYIYFCSFLFVHFCSTPSVPGRWWLVDRKDIRSVKPCRSMYSKSSALGTWPNLSREYFFKYTMPTSRYWYRIFVRLSVCVETTVYIVKLISPCDEGGGIVVVFQPIELIRNSEDNTLNGGVNYMEYEKLYFIFRSIKWCTRRARIRSIPVTFDDLEWLWKARREGPKLLSDLRLRMLVPFHQRTAIEFGTHVGRMGVL